MPLHQQQAVKSFGEEREAIVEEVEKMLAGIPKLRSQAKKELMEQTVYAHYFYGQSDWFILEYSTSDDSFYGYVILNGDSQMSESGYIGRRDLTESNRVELDFYWKPVALGEALHKADPGFFQAPKSKEQPATAELIAIGLGTEGRGTLQSWGKALPVMEWLRINTPFLFPKEPTKENPATFRMAEGATIELLASLYDNKIRVFAPKFKKGDTALYKGKPVVIKNDGAFDTIARDWIYLTKGSDWDEPDNVGENHLSIATMLPDWSGFTAADETNELVDSQAKSKRLRLAQAKAKAQAARIRILKLKSQKAA